MKFRRFTSAGIAAVRDFLAKCKAAAALDLPARDALLADTGPSELVAELADLDFDPTRTFATTFAFCEYLHSIIKDRKPLAYRTDVGFWTYLAMAYLEQLVRDKKEGVDIGALDRLILNPLNYQREYRHLLAGPYYLYLYYGGDKNVCRVVATHSMNVHPDLTEQFVSRNDFVHNPAYLATANILYYDPIKDKIRRGANGAGAGSPRQLVRVIDQLALTRDFFDVDDAAKLVELLPEQFSRFLQKVQE